ncbi:hypothetical protein ACWGE0_16245 [Lentzea sp. NPDC054927]
MVTLPRVPVERHEIGIDVLFGAVPNRQLDASLEAVARQQESHGIRRGLMCSLRGALFDVCSGNDDRNGKFLNNGGRHGEAAGLRDGRTGTSRWLVVNT